MTRLEYFDAAEGVKAGYLRRQTVDAATPANRAGLNLITDYQVNSAGVTTSVTTPKGRVVQISVDALNRVTEVTRTLPPRRAPGTGTVVPQVAYATRYSYCRNMRVERIEQDLADEAGRPVAGGTAVQVFAYDENDNVIREEIGGPEPENRLATRHKYVDGNLKVGTVLPRGNRTEIRYNERRLPSTVVRGAGADEAATTQLEYDGDGLLLAEIDGRGLRTEYSYDSFCRRIESRDYDERGQLYRLIRQDYDKSGNLVVERLLVPEGPRHL